MLDAWIGIRWTGEQYAISLLKADGNRAPLAEAATWAGAMRRARHYARQIGGVPILSR